MGTFIAGETDIIAWQLIKEAWQEPGWKANMGHELK